MTRLPKLIVWLCVCLFFSCSEKVATPELAGLMYQVADCQRTNIIAAVTRDSCFTYQFADALIVDFCVTGNCCPDSNHFSFSHQIVDDLRVYRGDNCG